MLFPPLCLIACIIAMQPADPPESLDALLQGVQGRVVKVHGGRIGRELGFASGVIVSADGEVITVLSSLLESQSIRVVLADGRRFVARVKARDPRLRLALLAIDAQDLPYFDLQGRAAPQRGDWLIAAANPFKVAEGPEPVSIMLGTMSGRVELSGRRRAQDFPYDGEVLLTDMLVNTPGCAGGAITDLDGRLAGVIGQAALSNLTNTWLNYAIPIDEVAAFVERARSGATAEIHAAAEQAPSAMSLGIRLFDVGGRIRPAYVERVRPGSSAEHGGLRADDLILAVDERPVTSCGDVDRILAERSPGPLRLTVKRGEQVVSLTIAVVDSQ